MRCCCSLSLFLCYDGTKKKKGIREASIDLWIIMEPNQTHTHTHREGSRTSLSICVVWNPEFPFKNQKIPILFSNRSILIGWRNKQLCANDSLQHVSVSGELAPHPSSPLFHTKQKTYRDPDCPTRSPNRQGLEGLDKVSLPPHYHHASTLRQVDFEFQRARGRLGWILFCCSLLLSNPLESLFDFCTG